MEKLVVYKEGMTREEKLVAANEQKPVIMDFFFNDKKPDALKNQEFPRIEMTDFQLDPKNNGYFLAQMELINNDLGEKDSIQYFDISLSEEHELLGSIERTYLSPEEVRMKEAESYGEQVEPIEYEYDGSYYMSEILEAELTKKADLFQESSEETRLVATVTVDADSNKKFLSVKDTQTKAEFEYPIDEADLTIKIQNIQGVSHHPLRAVLSESNLREVTDALNMLESVSVDLSEDEKQNLPEEVMIDLLENYELQSEIDSQGGKEMEDTANFEEMKSAYNNALIFQESFGIHSDSVEWENPRLINHLKENDPAGLEYFQSLKRLDEQYDNLTHEVGTWKEQPEMLTKDDMYKKERFSQFINQLEIFQSGPMTQQDSDLLKASYTKDEEYHVVFGLDFDNKEYGRRTGLESANHQIYDAVYKGGEIVSLHPENEVLMEHLQTYHAYPDNIITENDKAYLLSFSNEFVKNIEEYQSIIDELKSERSEPARGFEKLFNEAIHKETPVERLEALRNMREEMSKSADRFARMDQILLDTHPVMKTIMEKEDYRPEIKSDMERLYQKFDNPELFGSGKFMEIRVLREVATQITSLEMQNVRKEGLEGELFKNPEQAVIFSRFDEMKPFSLSVSAEPAKYEGASKFFETLNKEAINDPKEIVQHYVQVIDSISHYEEISSYTQVDMVRLSEYAEQALQEAVQVMDNSFEKDFPASPDMNVKLESEILYDEKYEGEWKIEEIYDKAEPFRAIAALPKEQPLTILNVANAQNINAEQKDFWNAKAIEMVQNHAGRPFQISPEKTEDGIFKIDYSNVKQSLEMMKDSHIRNGSFGQPRIENQMLEYINKLEKEQGPLKEAEQKQEPKQEKKQLVELDR